jgi:hypothetical protein
MDSAMLFLGQEHQVVSAVIFYITINVMYVLNGGVYISANFPFNDQAVLGDFSSAVSIWM